MNKRFMNRGIAGLLLVTAAMLACSPLALALTNFTS